MISPEDIKKKAEKIYYDFLKYYLEKNYIFPLEIPSDKKIPNDFAQYTTEVKKLIDNSKNKKGSGYSLEFKKINNKKYGLQTVVDRIFFENENDFLKFISKEKEFDNFIKNVVLIKEKIPELNVNGWIYRNTKEIIENNNKWEQLIKVVIFFLRNPKSGLYLREITIESIDTKFIENNKEIIRKLLDELLEENINFQENIFEKRFNLKYNLPTIKIRILDSDLLPDKYPSLNEFEVNTNILNNMNIPCEKVFIVENKLTHNSIFNFLTFPKVEASIAIFGSGYKVNLLKEISWLKNKQIYYWGDIDIHGFDILSKLRKYFPNTTSILMDFKTLNEFKNYQVNDNNKLVNIPEGLNESEKEIYLYISENSIRLEQERINQEYVNEILKLYA